MKRRRNPPVDFGGLDLRSLYNKWLPLFRKESGVMPSSITFSFTKRRGVAAIAVITYRNPPIDPSKWQQSWRGRRPKRGISEKAVPTKAEIRFSTTSIYDDSRLDGLMLHEMIHIWMGFNGFPNESHGTRFREMLTRLSRETGIDIPLTHNAPEEEANVKPRVLTVVFTIDKTDSVPLCGLYIERFHDDSGFLNGVHYASQARKKKYSVYRIPTTAYAFLPVKRTPSLVLYEITTKIAKSLDLLSHDPVRVFRPTSTE
jgi:hypothetical protein